jgi:hypothetical protein
MLFGSWQIYVVLHIRLKVVFISCVIVIICRSNIEFERTTRSVMIHKKHKMSDIYARIIKK